MSNLCNRRTDDNKFQNFWLFKKCNRRSKFAELFLDLGQLQFLDVDNMATRYLNLRFKFGGILVSEVGPIYVGGRTEYVENVDEDHLSIPELADYAKSFGISDIPQNRM
ncbi:hypothetical protein H5410_064930 [Solanum commersonii]|uniref:PB1-like domain-containing protein n=1 Tax=Solanum commersonii TaxID=4109 RepID=A0A9J5VY02_SOLCO|nr:hypothetical protein H5410_064930 [Solanum commersonii]